MLRQRRTMQLTKHRLHASALSTPFLLLLLFASACCCVHSQCTSNHLTKTPVVDPNIKVTAPDGKSSFWFFATQVNWCTAEASCKDHGGHLASVLTSAENQLVLDTCFNKLISDPQGGCWIGLNDINTEGTYQWTDNSTVYYTGWYTGSDFRQPDDATQADNEDCVFAIKAFAGWHDRSCDALYSYVCRVPVSANTTLPPSPPSGVAASVAKTTEVPGVQPTPPTVAPPPQPPPESKTDWRVVVATVAPILTGTAALMAIAYTGWKWWHKRKATLERKKVQSMAIGMYDAGIKPAGVKPVDAV